MLNATVELFMSEYFFIKAILGKYLSDSEKLFKALSKIFLIPEGEAEKLYSLSENDTASAIATDNDFMQYQRIRKYTEITGSDRVVNDEWEEVARIKGNAILIAQNSNLILDADASRNVVYTCLSSAAAAGLVGAIRVFGILQCEGIFLGKNEKAGVKALSKSADWNDSVSILALLHYCGDARKFNMARLRQTVENTPFEELHKTAVKIHGEAGPSVQEVKLLDKAFNSGMLKREVCDPKYARILNSPALSVKDKEKAVFSLNKELLCAISDLPLKLSHGKTSVEACGAAALMREKEISAISRALKNSDLRGLPTFRPLCLSCDSNYVLETYARAIGGDSEVTHVELIDVAELGEYEFEPTPNNIFVRSIDEDKDNRFLLFFRGEISERKIDAVKSFLQSSRRAKFHLNSPSVTLDLSAVLPVCFSDERNAKWLKQYCDEIKLSKVSSEEMPVAIADVLENVRKLYGVGTIEFTEEISEVFKGFDIDTAERLIDCAVLARRERGASVTLSRDILKESAGDNEKQTIGFGGNTNGR